MTRWYWDGKLPSQRTHFLAAQECSGQCRPRRALRRRAPSTRSPPSPCAEGRGVTVCMCYWFSDFHVDLSSGKKRKSCTFCYYRRMFLVSSSFSARNNPIDFVHVFSVWHFCHWTHFDFFQTWQIHRTNADVVHIILEIFMTSPRVTWQGFKGANFKLHFKQKYKFVWFQFCTLSKLGRVVSKNCPHLIVTPSHEY